MNKRRDSSPEHPAKRIRCDNFSRPPAPQLNSTTDKLIFQELEVDHYIGPVYPGMPGPGPQTGLVPIIRMYGITKDGNSVCCHIHGFLPYFHVNVPKSFTTVDLAPFKTTLNDAVLADQRSSNELDVPEAVINVELVEGKSLVEYTGNKDDKFAKITLAVPKHVAAAKRLITTTIVYQPMPAHKFFVLESDLNTDIETRFMVDSQILGSCWIELSAEKWFRRSQFSDFKVTSRCQIEVDVSWVHLIVRAPEGEYAPEAKFRILSFDIECTVRGDIIPVPKVDPIIQIANVVKCLGEKDVLFRNVFTLKSCASIDDAEVYSFDKEEDMLEEWANFVRSVDPDVFTGYNINNFDFPYLINRAKHLKLDRFPYLGRILDVASQVKKVVTKIKVGWRPYKFVNFSGIILYDMFLATRRHFKLTSYSLNNVCKEMLGEQKDDVHYSIIADLQNGNSQTRKRLAIHCLNDAGLAVKLFQNMPSFTQDLEMTRSKGGSITSLFL